MAFNKITDVELVNKGVTGLADTPGLSATDMQKKFDELSRDVIIPKYNQLVDELNSNGVAENSMATDPVDGSEKALQGVIDSVKASADAGISEAKEQATGQVDELKTYTDGALEALDGKLTSAIEEVGSTADGKISAHTSRTDNPHEVTADQVGAYTTSQVDENMALKVDKVAGKGLSTNDYTNEEKASVSANTSARHTHANKTLLDSLTNAILTTVQNVATMFASITGVTTSVVDSDEKIPTSGAIVDYVSGLGGGDMLKSTYDKNNDGIVDNSKALNGHNDTYFAKATDVIKKTDIVDNLTSTDNQKALSANQGKVIGDFLSDTLRAAGEYSPTDPLPRDADTLGGKYSSSDIDVLQNDISGVRGDITTLNGEVSEISESLNAYREWKLVGSVTGTTPINLPSDIKEVWVGVKAGGSSVTLSLVVPYDYLTDTESIFDTTSSWVSSSNMLMGQVRLSKTKAYLNYVSKPTDVTSTSTLVVYAR